MITIKLSSPFVRWDWSRQTPNHDGIWKNHKFICNKKNSFCDYWVVYENLIKKETVLCPPNNTILITGEPPTVNTYHPKFLAQFKTIITCHPSLPHPNTIISHSSLPWMVGYQPPKEKFSKSYHELNKIKNYPKTKLISVICSNKTFTRDHKNRFEFVQKLKNYFGNKIDFFGRGFTPIQDKWDAIAPYKYHIALENCSIKHYWTEKLADSYLAQAYPIYYGCPNIHDYFPENSLSQINIHKPKQAIKIIENIIQNKTYEQSIKSLVQAKKLILDTHNIFPRMTKFCPQINRPKAQTTLFSQECFYKQDPILTKIIRKTVRLFSTIK